MPGQEASAGRGPTMDQSGASDTSGLFEAIRRRDREAFTRLIRSESDRIYRIAWRVTGDPGLAEDVVQETFLRVLQGKLPSRRGGCRAWLVRVAVRLSIDLLRRKEAGRRHEGAQRKPLAGSWRRRETADEGKELPGDGCNYAIAYRLPAPLISGPIQSPIRASKTRERTPQT